MSVSTAAVTSANQKMPTRPRLKRKTRRKEGMASKELLLVRLLVSGLGLEPRWLLNRLKTEIKQSQFLPCQVQRKVEDKERAVAVETGKAKEESLKVVGARCWKRILLRCLQETGNIYICFSGKVILVALDYASDLNVTFLLQRLGSCPSSPFL